MSAVPGTTAYYDIVFIDLFNCLKPQMLRKKENDDDTLFATKHVAREFFQHENLRRFYRCVSSTGVDDDGSLDIGEDEFVRRVLERELQPFVATLVFFGAPKKALKAFVANVVAKPADIGTKLPLKQDRLNEIFFEDPTTIQNFSHNQHRFCTLTLFQDSDQMVLEDNDTARLPYMEERPIGEGGFGTVWEIKIPYGHFAVRTGGEASFLDGPKIVARKEFVRSKANAKKDFEEELDRYKEILSSAIKCDNVLLIYGAIESSSGSTFSLLMPKAEYNLYQYMDHYGCDHTKSIENMARHMSYAAGMARGVAHLHNGIEIPGRQKLECFHMDLKPANVLVFHEHDKIIWKISDFGLSRTKTFPGGSRSTARSLAPSPTTNRAGEGTYLAPESESDRGMTEKSDVWSLGCIISVLCVWLQKGRNGVKEYTKSRTESNNGDSSRFFSHKRFSRVKPNPQIAQWHKKLISGEGDKDIRDSLEYILKYLEDKVLLIDGTSRVRAGKIKERLENTATKGLKRVVQPTYDERSVDYVNNRSASVVGSYSGASSVRGWRISVPVPVPTLQGCQFSPDGDILSYYTTSNQILLYSASGRFPEESGGLLPVSAPIHLHPTHIVDIGVTKNYMVIAENARDFQFTLVSFIDAVSNSPRFDHRTFIRMDTVPSIHLIAISPLGRWIACIVKGEPTGSLPGRLYLAKREDITGPARDQSGQLNESVWRHKDLPEWTNNDANSVTSLRFSTESSIWFAGISPREHRNHVITRLPLARGDTRPLRGFESVFFKEPISCFAPCYNSNRCIIVVKGHTVVTHDFGRLSSPGIKNHVNERFQIYQIVTSKYDPRILALARPNTTYGELCLVELSVEERYSKVGVSVISRFKVQYMDHSLSKVQLRWLEPEPNAVTQNPISQDNRALIAVLAQPHRNAVFEVDMGR
ncbi:hypothetical protein ANO14919_107060 [Xylariales sp. No.14919]|nr:hypothetical protein ANO14919_107060 [Xylariales sp. No.14919]